MDHQFQIPHLREISIFLLTAAIFVPVFQRFRVSPVLGFLIVGAVVGPYGLGLLTGQFPVLGYAVLDNIEGVAAIAELGVVFLLFTVGLELSPERLWSMRRLVFGLGAGQVGASALVIGLVALAYGNGIGASIVIGASLALSSTAIVIKLLMDQKAFGSRAGRTAFSILLFQDLAVVPILFLATLFADTSDQGAGVELILALGKAVVAVMAILFTGRIVLRPLFRFVASQHSPELFMALTLLSILATAAATSAAGLSLAMGGFLAGLLLAETEFRHQVEVDIEPFRGLFLGLFFLSIGMGLDFRIFSNLAPEILASVVGLYCAKSLIAGGLALRFGLSRSAAVRVGLLLGQGGEFAFVVLGVAVAGRLLPIESQHFFLVVTTLTMVITPVVAAGSQILENRMRSTEEAGAAVPFSTDVQDMDGHIIIAGFGRSGRLVANMLDDQKVPYVALDLSGAKVTRFREQGVPVFYGDASRKEVLRKLGADHAAGLILTLDTPESTAKAVASVVSAWPNLAVYARARDTEHAHRLEQMGAAMVIPETAESSLQLAGAALSALGVPNESVAQLKELVREHRYAELSRPDLESDSKKT